MNLIKYAQTFFTFLSVCFLISIKLNSIVFAKPNNKITNPKVNKKYLMKASYYGDQFHGRKTANGEVFNKNQLTAAHKSLPFNTKLLITYPQSGKSVIVRINDRGPYINGRDIDLSEKAASVIGMKRAGVAKIVVKTIG